MQKQTTTKNAATNGQTATRSNRSTEQNVNAQPKKKTGLIGGKLKDKISRKSAQAAGTEFRKSKPIGKRSKTKAMEETIKIPKTKVRGFKITTPAASARIVVPANRAKKTSHKKATELHAVFTSSVLRALQAFQDECCADYNIDTIFDNALTYGFRCGLMVYKDGKAIDNQDNWTITGRKRIIALRDALKTTLLIAKSIKNDTITAKMMHQHEFADLWEQCEATDKMLYDIFEVSMFYRHLLPGDGAGQSAWLLVDQAKLLQASWAIKHSVTLALQAIAEKETMASVQRFNESFPHLQVPLATKKKKFLINFEDFDTEKVVWVDFEGELGANHYPYELSDVQGYFILSEVKSISNVEQSEPLSTSK